MPTATAPMAARSSCTRARLSGEEIQRGPAGEAVRPSALIAAL